VSCKYVKCWIQALYSVLASSADDIFFKFLFFLHLAMRFAYFLNREMRGMARRYITRGWLGFATGMREINGLGFATRMRDSNFLFG
jgi:hypothetical protein